MTTSNNDSGMHVWLNADYSVPRDNVCLHVHSRTSGKGGGKGRCIRPPGHDGAHSYRKVDIRDHACKGRE